MQRQILLWAAVVFSGAAMAQSAAVQSNALTDDLASLTNTPAVSGYETALLQRLAQMLAASHPKRDTMGHLTVQFGSGSPHRLQASG